MENWRSTVWTDQDALNYSNAIGISDYVQSVVPHIVAERSDGFASMLDVGAGDGRFAHALTRPDARVDAVEPSSIMRYLLQERLKGRAVRTWDTSWQAYPDHDRYELGFAANMVAFKTAPVELYQKMRRQCETLVWVVPAQNGPSTFCLCGLVAHWLPQENTVPVFHDVLKDLGEPNAPSSVTEQSWAYRQWFASAEIATQFLKMKLDSAGTEIRHATVRDFVAEKGAFDTDGGVVLEAMKRSAILRWN